MSRRPPWKNNVNSKNVVFVGRVTGPPSRETRFGSIVSTGVAFVPVDHSGGHLNIINAAASADRVKPTTGGT